MRAAKVMKAVLVGSALMAAGAAGARTVVDGQANNWDVFMQLYPKRALAAGEQGLVAFKLTLDRNGHPTACQVTHSSGHAALDNETCNILMYHAEFKPPRDANGTRIAAQHTEGVINWRLPTSQAALKAPVKVASADPLDKKICKRQQRTGSLAGFERTCMTAREWDRQGVTNRAAWDEYRARESRLPDNQ